LIKQSRIETKLLGCYVVEVGEFLIHGNKRQQVCFADGSSWTAGDESVWAMSDR
jgi:hypothetical protein